jgi:hypothetical protein
MRLALFGKHNAQAGELAQDAKKIGGRLRVPAAGARNVLRCAEQGHEELESYSHVQNPEKVADYGEQKRQQPLGRRDLKAIEHVPGGHNQSQQQMDAIEELRVLLGDEILKRKIQQAFEETFAFAHVRRL